MAFDWMNRGMQGVGNGMARLGFDPTGVRRGAVDLLGNRRNPMGLPGRLGIDPLGVRGGRSAAYDFGQTADPFNLRGTSKGVGLTGFLANKWGNPLTDPAGFQAFLAKTYDFDDPMGPSPAGTTPGTNGPAPTGNEWAAVNQWSNAINAASGKYGVPGNLIRAVMQLESGGVNAKPNGAGAMGPMQVVGHIWGGTAANLGYNLSNGNDNIMMGAYILQQNYNRCGSWQGALNAYYSGSCVSTGARDNPAQGGSGITDNEYVNRIWSTYQQIERQGGGTGYNPAGSGGPVGNLSSVWGGANYPVSFEFNAGGGPDLYGYGTGYGLNGSNHTGLDVSMPIGTTLYSPGNGTVTCAGTGNGSGAGGSGCAAFNDYMGQGAGRVEVQLDNGVVLIYGHSSRSLVQPGQRVGPGTPVASSGGMNGAHVHLEARVRDPSMPSGWRIVDPRTVLGGSYVPPSGSVPGGAPASGYTAPMSFNDTIMSFMRGNVPQGW